MNFLPSLFRPDDKTSVTITISTYCCTKNIVQGPRTSFLTAQHPGGALWVQTGRETNKFIPLFSCLPSKGALVLRYVSLEVLLAFKSDYLKDFWRV
jgi:hypothetical protein